MASSSYTAPTFTEYPELKVTKDTGNYYIHSNIDGDFIGEDFYEVKNGTFENVLGYYAYYEYIPQLGDYFSTEKSYYEGYGNEIKKNEYESKRNNIADNLKTPEFSNLDYSNITLKCNTEKALKDLKNFYNWRSECYFNYHYDINGDGIKDSLYVLYNAAKFWQNRCYEVKSFGGENHLFYKDNKATVLVAESTDGGIKLRTCRLDAKDTKNELQSDKILLEYNLEEGMLRIGDHIYTYNPEGKPFTDNTINYVIDLMDNSPEEVESKIEGYFELGDSEPGIAQGYLYGSFLSLVFSENYGLPRENSTLAELTITPSINEKCYLIKGVDTSMTLDTMLKNAENCNGFSDLRALYDLSGNVYGYETYTVYTHTDNNIYGVTAVFDSLSPESHLNYMRIVKLGEANNISGNMGMDMDIPE